MRYVRKADLRAARINTGVGNISVTGSVRGMQMRYGWKPGGQVRIGSYVYNIGTAEVSRLRSQGFLRGENR